MSYGTLISTVTVGAGGAASIDFTSIPQTYTDLIVVLTARNPSGGGQANYITFNSSTTSFSNKYLYGNGSAVSSSSLARYIGSSAGDYTVNTFNSTMIYIPNYAGSTNKSFSVDNVTENNATGADQNIIAGLWSNTAAITSISLVPSAVTWSQYSQAWIYGIK